MQVDLGVRTDRTLTFSLPLTRERLNTRERIEAFYRDLVERLRTVPRVTHASVSTGLPVQGRRSAGRSISSARRRAMPPRARARACAW